MLKQLAIGVQTLNLAGWLFIVPWTMIRSFRFLLLAGLVFVLVAAGAAEAGAMTYLGCRSAETEKTGGMSLRIKPKRCNTLGPEQSFSQAANLAHMHWTSWGARVARGSGVSLGEHHPYSQDRVRVKLYRQACPNSLANGGALFARMRLTFDDGSVSTIDLGVQC